MGEETSLKLYFHEMQLQVIWSTEENQVFASEENMVFIQVKWWLYHMRRSAYLIWIHV